MKAAQINEYGDASVITINEVSIPSPTDNQVLVRVQAVSLNPFDSTVRNGYMKEAIPLTFPVTIGGDIAGVIESIGSEVTGFSVGDIVYGQANVVAGDGGAFAEFAVTNPNHIAKAPTNLPVTEAASLPLVGVSALQALTQHIDLQPGQKIFIHGGAGNIGLVAIQIAKYIGAYIATTATSEDIEAVKRLGADEVIDYKTQDFAKILENYDAVFDTVGGEDFNRSLNILKPEGIAVSMVAQADETIAKGLGVNTISQMTQITAAALDELTKLVEAKVIVPHIGKVFPLEEIRNAFEARENGAVHGKIVIEL